jgi:hypothetical protein
MYARFHSGVRFSARYLVNKESQLRGHENERSKTFHVDPPSEDFERGERDNGVSWRTRTYLANFISPRVYRREGCSHYAQHNHT